MHVTDWLPTLMGAATHGQWTGSYGGSHLNEVDMLGTILGGASAAATSWAPSSGCRSIAYFTCFFCLVYLKL